MKIFKSVILAISFVVLTAIYIIFDYGYIQCEIIDCQKIDSELISKASNSAFPLNKADETINQKTENLNKATQTANTHNNDAVNRKKEYDEAFLNLSKDTANNQNLKNANLDANANLKKAEANQNAANTERANAQTELNNARKFMADRYSQRLIWIFFAAVFLALCIASIAFSVYVMNQAYSKYGKIFGIGAAIVALIFAIVAYNSNYMSVVGPMLEQSVGTGDLSIDAINFLNVIGFSAIIFLIAASCAILYAVEELNAETNPARISKNIAKLKSAKEALTEKLEVAMEADKPPIREALTTTESDLETEEAKLEKYEPWRERLRLLLYVGAVMLFVSIFRIDVLSDWHRFFVKDEFKTTLEGFFTTLLSVQAGFYTILLLMLYVPVSYFMPETEKSPGVQEKLKEGIIPTIKEFLPRAILLISPLLAEPISKFVKYFFPN